MQAKRQFSQQKYNKDRTALFLLAHLYIVKRLYKAKQMRNVYTNRNAYLSLYTYTSTVVHLRRRSIFVAQLYRTDRNIDLPERARVFIAQHVTKTKQTKHKTKQWKANMIQPQQPRYTYAIHQQTVGNLLWYTCVVNKSNKRNKHTHTHIFFMLQEISAKQNYLMILI